MYCRIIAYFEEMAEKLATEEGLSDPVQVSTENLAFIGTTVS